MSPFGTDSDPSQPQHAAEDFTLRAVNPDRVPIAVEGRPRPLMAWRLGDQRAPVSVYAELEDARIDYAERLERKWDGPPPPDFVESVRDLVREWEQTPSEAVFDLGPHMEVIRQALRAYDETPQYKSARRHFEAYVTRCLQTLIPGLDEDQAEFMPRDTRIAWLIALGWFQPQQRNGSAGGGGHDNPPAQADESTAGDEPAPDSPASTE